MISPLNYPIRKIFWLALLLIPFTSTKAFLPLGELKNDIAIQITLFGFCIYFINQLSEKKIFFPIEPIYKWLYVFLVWIMISSLANFPEISSSIFKGKAGIGRVISQSGIFIVFSFFCVKYFSFNIKFYSNEELLNRLNNIILIVFYATSIYAFTEICYGINGISIFGPIYDFFNVIIFKESSQSWNFGRISGVTQEPPFLAMYLVFVSPWIFYQILLQKSYLKYIPLLILFITMYYAGSRTALLINTFQFVLFLILSFYNKKLKIKVLEIFLIGTILISSIGIAFGYKIFESATKFAKSLTDNKKENIHNVSNITRWGTQKAALKIFYENKLFGVGIGQQGYYLIKNYDPEDVKLSWELRENIDPKGKFWPPGFSMLTRLLSETGLIGAFLFFGFNIHILYLMYKKYKNEMNSDGTITIIILTALCGYFINFFQFDSFRLLGYWFYIAWAIHWLNTKNEKQNISTNHAL